ncbi:LPS translocon maturation chaperone LptM [Azohydromonas caseinilytica]|uniref:Lipoprotein n=1 Tax=Azohydromonas caseinilytica TaxID=2728836 RepID=A0A848F4B3_9BURK|nr:lipoprotein [Azohydromonas caseinilytica]NML13459.1 lipoprotein [Azohydromonas caseinilytica]
MNTKSRTSVAARRSRSAAKLLLAMGALASFAACGQKGPLRLPENKPAAAPAATPAASAPATPSGAAQ